MEKRSPADVPMEHIGHRILVKCLHFSYVFVFQVCFIKLLLVACINDVAGKCL